MRQGFIWIMLELGAMALGGGVNGDEPGDGTYRRGERETEAKKSERGYVPGAVGRIDDLTVSAAAILRQLPGVIDVQIHALDGPVTGRLIHLRDWHYVSRDFFA